MRISNALTYWATISLLASSSPCFASGYGSSTKGTKGGEKPTEGGGGGGDCGDCNALEARFEARLEEVKKAHEEDKKAHEEDKKAHEEDKKALEARLEAVKKAHEEDKTDLEARLKFIESSLPPSDMLPPDSCADSCERIEALEAASCNSTCDRIEFLEAYQKATEPLLGTYFPPGSTSRPEGVVLGGTLGTSADRAEILWKQLNTRWGRLLGFLTDFGTLDPRWGEGYLKLTADGLQSLLGNGTLDAIKRLVANEPFLNAPQNPGISEGKNFERFCKAFAVLSPPQFPSGCANSTTVPNTEPTRVEPGIDFPNGTDFACGGDPNSILSLVGVNNTNRNDPDASSLRLWNFDNAYKFNEFFLNVFDLKECEIACRVDEKCAASFFRLYTGSGGAGICTILYLGSSNIPDFQTLCYADATDARARDLCLNFANNFIWTRCPPTNPP